MAQLKDLLVLGQARIIGNLYGTLKGNADTASSAAKLTTARTISLGGNLSGSASFDGTGNITIAGQVNTVRDSFSGKAINITYNKAGQASTSWLASWNNYELGAISPSKITAGAAAKLTVNGGSATQPVYFANGVPTACTYTLSKSVPSNAVFTDTNNKVTQTAVTASDYTNWRPIVWGASNSGTEGFTPTTTTDGTFTTNTLSVQPSSGTIRATTFKGALSGNASTASVATKLGTSAGSATQPVYFSDGKPVACTYTVNKSVPANAVFTDTVYTLPAAGSTLGGVKTTSTVTSASGYTACPIIGGVPYYKDTNTTYGLSSFGISASATELNYTKGVTSAIQTQLNGKVPTGRKINNKALSADISLTAADVGAAASSHTHNYAGSSSAGGAANSAVKLQTARTIQITGGAASSSTSLSFDGSSNQNIALPTVYASYLSWGGRNINGDISPLDAAMSYLHSANRAQFSNPAGITVEYSRNGGSSWTDYGATNEQKVNFVSGAGVSFFLGGPSANGNSTTSDQLRITIQPNKCGFYTNLKTVLINMSVGGNSGCKVKIEYSNRGSDTNFTKTIGTYDIYGWSGWNSIPIQGSFGGGDTQTHNIGALRFTFTHTTVASSKPATQILNMMILGTTAWQYNSNMANTGHIYSWDYQQNVFFPASVSATSFSGNASSASTAAKLDTSTAGSAIQPVYFTGGKPTACTYTLGKSVPSDAKFTDTVYTLPTANGSTLGGVKTTSTVTSNSGYTACPIINGVPYYKDTNTTYSLSSFGLTASATEINYTKGVTSAIQTQLNNKVPTSRTINGKALSANISLTASDVGAAASGHTHNKTATATLSASKWSNKAQSVSVSGVTASNTVIVSAAPGSYTKYCEASVYCSAQGSGTLTFTCDTVPTADITANIVILGG